MPAPSKLAKSIEAAFAERGWVGKLQTDDAGRWIRSVAFTQPAWAAGVAFVYDSGPEVLVVYVGYPDRIPEAARPRVAEAITRANYGFVGACLEMDFATGDLRSRATLLAGAKTTSVELARNLLATAAEFLTTYAPAIDAVLAGEEPRSAVARARAVPPV